MRFRVEMRATVEIDVKDLAVVERITGPDGDEWRSMFYDLRTRDDVLEMLASNAVRNGTDRANRLDGWADMADDAATMFVPDAELDVFDAVTVASAEMTE